MLKDMLLSKLFKLIFSCTMNSTTIIKSVIASCGTEMEMMKMKIRHYAKLQVCVRRVANMVQIDPGNPV